MSFYLLAVLSLIVDLSVQAILETMLSSQDTDKKKTAKHELYKRVMQLENIRKTGNCSFQDM